MTINSTVIDHGIGMKKDKKIVPGASTRTGMKNLSYNVMYSAAIQVLSGGNSYNVNLVTGRVVYVPINGTSLYSGNIGDNTIPFYYLPITSYGTISSAKTVPTVHFAIAGRNYNYWQAGGSGTTYANVINATTGADFGNLDQSNPVQQYKHTTYCNATNELVGANVNGSWFTIWAENGTLVKHFDLAATTLCNMNAGGIVLIDYDTASDSYILWGSWRKIVISRVTLTITSTTIINPTTSNVNLNWVVPLSDGNILLTHGGYGGTGTPAVPAAGNPIQQIVSPSGVVLKSIVDTKNTFKIPLGKLSGGSVYGLSETIIMEATSNRSTVTPNYILIGGTLRNISNYLMNGVVEVTHASSSYFGITALMRPTEVKLTISDFSNLP